MRKTLCIITAIAELLLLSACQSETPTADEIIPEEIQTCTVKWCIQECGLDENAVGKLNDALREDGCEYSIELVQIPLEPTKLYSEQVLEYEENYGNLDVVSTGYVFSGNIGETNEFIKSGYYIELEDLSAYASVPEKLWETVRTNGKIYTVPDLNVNDTGTTFYFNKAYITQEQFEAFDGDIAKLEEMTVGLSAAEDFLPVYYSIDYTGWCHSVPYTQKGGLIFDNVSGNALSPYEYDPFIEYARKLNELYKKGLLGDKINFSVHDSPNEDTPKDFAVMAVSISLDESYLSEMIPSNIELYRYTLPSYLESRVLYSMGVSANSEHKEFALDFLKRLYSDTKYAGILFDNGSQLVEMAIGVSNEDIKEKYENVLISDFVGFELCHKDIDADLEDLLISRFDVLCKSEDFDKTLEEINSELKTAGIDEYVDKVNKILEENTY